MNIRHAVSLALAAAGLALAPALYAASDDGLFDLGVLKGAKNDKTVEINLQPGLLSIAAKIVDRQEPEAAQLLRELRHVRVNVAKLDDSNKAEAAAQIAAIQERLARENWLSVVKVREPGDKGVDVFMKARGDEAIEGLVVIVQKGGREVVLVNIAGNIRPENISKLAEKLNIEPLKELKLGGRSQAGRKAPAATAAPEAAPEAPAPAPAK